MRIGIIGAGDIGGTLARLFVRAGHTVSVSNSRGPGSLAALVAELGPNGQARTKDDVLGDADLVILAAHWRQTEALPSPQQVTGKIVIDTMNPYTPDGGQFDLGDSTPSEETARRLPGARLVKAFNTMWWKHLAERGRTDLSVDQRQALFIAGDDASAKRIVAALIEQIGFACVDTGTLKDGGRLQAVGSPLYNSPMTGVQARTAIDALQGASTSRDGAVKAELDRLTREFFKAVSFEAGETPPYENIHALFIEPGPTPPRCSSSRAGARCRCSPGPTC